MTEAGMAWRAVVREAARCAVRALGLLGPRRLHLPRTHVGATVVLPDGRTYEVFRESTCDTSDQGTPVMLSVWFRLRAIPPGARVRRRLFERICVVNTVLFAGCDGYLVKLWMVNPVTSDYAGLYSWSSADKAEHYGRYITTILRPLSQPGSTGFHVHDEWTLADYLERGGTACPTPHSSHSPGKRVYST
jgi:hypothetical protein